MNEYQRILEANGINESDFYELVKQQTVLMGKIPFDILQYGENCLAPMHENQHKILKQIHPRKRAAVERLIESDIPEGVHKIIIFGSGVGIHCKETSDLDICIVGNRTSKDEMKSPWIFPLNLGPADYLYMTDEDYNNADNPAFVGYDIKTQGVVVWETSEPHEHI